MHNLTASPSLPSLLPNLLILFLATSSSSFICHLFSSTHCCINIPRVLSPFRGGGIAYLIDPDSYTPVRATQVSQKGWMIEVRQSSSTVYSFSLPSFFLPFTFLFFFLLISPNSVIFSSIYNLFTLLGCKAPFTHSLTVLTYANVNPLDLTC